MFAASIGASTAGDEELNLVKDEVEKSQMIDGTLGEEDKAGKKTANKTSAKKKPKSPKKTSKTSQQKPKPKKKLSDAEEIARLKAELAAIKSKKNNKDESDSEFEASQEDVQVGSPPAKRLRSMVSLEDQDIRAAESNARAEALQEMKKDQNEVFYKGGKKYSKR